MRCFRTRLSLILPPAIPAAGSDRVFGENGAGIELFGIGAARILAASSEGANNEVNRGTPTLQDVVAASAEDVIFLRNFKRVTVKEIAEAADGRAVAKQPVQPPHYPQHADHGGWSRRRS